MTESTISSPAQPSLGQQLKEAREALNLTIEAVAQQTNLKKSHIESIENDIFILQNVAPTFVRGYVRNYVRFLRLPEDLVATVNYGEVTLPKEITNRVPAEHVVQKSQSTWVKYLTIAVLLGAIGMTLLWWYQDYQTEQENRDQFVSNAMPIEVATENKQESIAPVVDQPVTQPQVQTVAPAPAPKVEETAPVQPVVNTQEQQVVSTQPTAEVNVLQQPEQTAPATQPAVNGNDELRIEVSGKESWITVKNTKSKRSLAEKLYLNGEVLTFNGNEEYRLTIGAPANVKIYYKGQEVPLKIDGRVARIKLPLAQ